MCGICGIINIQSSTAVSKNTGIRLTRDTWNMNLPCKMPVMSGRHIGA
jgi:hypothetical protein